MILYHTKSILTNQITLFEGYNGSYFPPRHVPKIRTAFSMVQRFSGKLHSTNTMCNVIT